MNQALSKAGFKVGARPQPGFFRYQNRPRFSPFGPAYRPFKSVPNEYLRGFGNRSRIARPSASMPRQFAHSVKIVYGDKIDTGSGLWTAAFREWGGAFASQEQDTHRTRF
ncbi:hypothetical protein [Methylomonas koyamae]|uniref:hypothetical protein n=1 Tax=Methylomonas koyamae TaxID=702114 RepID=UPI0012F68FF9|nr:hypothetical protein [Methylomonas koyamae]